MSRRAGAGGTCIVRKSLTAAALLAPHTKGGQVCECALDALVAGLKPSVARKGFQMSEEFIGAAAGLESLGVNSTFLGQDFGGGGALFAYQDGICEQLRQRQDAEAIDSGHRGGELVGVAGASAYQGFIQEPDFVMQQDAEP